MARKRPTEKKTEARPSPGWYSRVEMAQILDVSVQQFDRTYRPQVPAVAVKEIDGRPWFRARGLIDAMADQAKKPPPEADDPLMSGEPTPALERYREGRVVMLDMDIAERRSQLVNRAWVIEAMQVGVASLRQVGDRLVRRFGNEAGEIYNEGVENFEQAAVASLEKRNDPNGSR